MKATAIETPLPPYVSSVDLIENMICGFMSLEPIRDGDDRPVDFQILAANPAFENLLGRKQAQAEGKTLREILPSVDPKWIHDLGDALETDGPVRFGGYSIDARRFLDFSAFCSGPGRIEVTFCEVPGPSGTRKNLDDALAQARQRTAETDALLTASHAILVHQTFQDAARAVFDSCKDLIGATAGYVALLSETGEENEVLFLEAGGRSCDVNPELPMPIRGLRAVAYQNHAPAFDNDFHNSRWMDFMPKGHVRLDNVLFAPLIIDNKAVGLIGLANKPSDFTEHDAQMALAFGELAAIALKNSQDLEKRLRAEKRLKFSKALLELTLDSLKSAVFLTDTKTHAILECNRAATEIFGYERKEIIGRTPEFLHIDAASRQTFLNLLRPAMMEKRHFELSDFRMKRKDGTIFPTEHLVLPFTDEETGRSGWMSIVQDVSERRQMEEQIRQARKMEAIGTLAGGIAHDFNNILFPILGHAEMLMEDVGDKDPEARESLSEIIFSTHRARDLVNQIMTFSQKTGRNLKPLNINRVVEEAAEAVRSILPGSVVLEKRIQPCDPISGDASHIHQMIMNLCTNACHAMQETGGVLTISLDPVDMQKKDIQGFPEAKPGPYVRLTVADTGTGISQAVRPMIFDPYFTTRDTGEGSGLGLSVVSGIVREHKGFITVESEPGQGSAFHLFLPVIEST